MSRRGAALPIRSTLGPSDRGTGRPGPGNGFETRYLEDLALFAELGVTDLRLGVDWARLQPSSGYLDDDWREWYQHVLAAAAQHGIGVWLGLISSSH